MLGEEQILWDIVEEHLDEAEFLVEQWQAARASALYSLEELSKGPEQRLEAHIDGLVVNGPLALQRVAWPLLEEGDELPRVAAAALAVLNSGDFRVLEALEETDDDEPEDEPEAPESDDAAEGAGSDPDYPAELLDLEALPPPSEDDEAKRQAELAAHEERLAGMDDDDDERPAVEELIALLKASPPDEDDDEAEAEPDAEDDPPADAVEPSTRADGIALAIGLCTHPKIGEHLRGRVAKAKGATLAMLLQACADRGVDPGPALGPALSSEDPEIAAAALRAAAFGDRHRLLAQVEARLQHPSPMVRTAALDTALCWGSRAAWELTMHSYRQPGARAAMVWMASLGDDRHAEALIKLLDDEAMRHDALWALGFSGRVPAIEACLAWVGDDDETTRRLAGEAITHILGLDIEDETLWEELSTEEPEPGLEGDDPDDDDDDLDAELAERPDDELPLPIATAFAELWANVKGGFTPGTRYLLGKPIGREGPGWILPGLSCRRVDVVARELVARSQSVARWPGRVVAQRHQQAASALEQLGRNAGAMQGDRR